MSERGLLQSGRGKSKEKRKNVNGPQCDEKGGIRLPWEKVSPRRRGEESLLRLPEARDPRTSEQGVNPEITGRARSSKFSPGRNHFSALQGGKEGKNAQSRKREKSGQKC